MTALHLSDKYEVIEQIGRGGMGVVYLARHRALRTMLAVKVLPPDLAENAELVNRFHQEARLMAQLKHPNIVHVMDVDKVGDTHYFIMEYIAGKSLGQHLREQSRLSLLETLGIARQIVSALEYAHKREPPVIHRDIKPDNILIESSSGRVVVTDFGIAKVLGARGYTSTDMVMGTLLYCAPEQVLQPDTLDGRADLYSLGMVMYELVSGHSFFAGLDERALLGQALHGPEENIPTFPTPTPPEFVALVTQAIARDPGQRYQRAADLRQDIEHCLAKYAPTVPTAYLTAPQHEDIARNATMKLPRPSTQNGEKPWLHAIRSPRVAVFLPLCVVLLAVFFLARNFLQGQTQASPSLVQNVAPSPLTSRMNIEPVNVEPVAETRQKEAPVLAANPIVETLEREGQEAAEASAPRANEEHDPPQQAPETSPPFEQEVFPSRQYRVTTLTVLRDQPTWKGSEIARLKPNTKIHVVALAGDWLKVESRSQPPKPPGYVWKDDARPE